MTTGQFPLTRTEADDEIERLTKQRDELVSGLEYVNAYLEEAGCFGMLRSDIELTLAKVKGGA
jgi:hypothetical protein